MIISPEECTQTISTTTHQTTLLKGARTIPPLCSTNSSRRCAIAARNIFAGGFWLKLLLRFWRLGNWIFIATTTSAYTWVIRTGARAKGRGSSSVKPKYWCAELPDTVCVEQLLAKRILECKEKGQKKLVNKLYTSSTGSTRSTRSTSRTNRLMA